MQFPFKLTYTLITFTIITVQQSFTLHIFKLHMNFRILLSTAVNNGYYCWSPRVWKQFVTILINEHQHFKAKVRNINRTIWIIALYHFFRTYAFQTFLRYKPQSFTTQTIHMQTKWHISNSINRDENLCKRDEF